MNKKVILVLTTLCFYFTVYSQESTFEWAKGIGGPRYDRGYSIALDALGNVYTTGFFDETVDFDPGPETHILTSVGGFNIFIQKLDALGNFVWVKQMEGFGIGNSIALDAQGNLYTTGIFGCLVDFDPGPEIYYLASTRMYNIFVQKLDASGNFVWAKRMGGGGTPELGDEGTSIAVDISGNVYTTGYFWEDTVDFNPGLGICNLVSAGNYDIFVQKLDASGNFVWAKQMGGPASDNGRSIAVDELGNLYITGSFMKTADFNPGPGTFNLTSTGYRDIFIQKLDSSGNFIWAKQMGGTDWDEGNSIALDKSGNVFTTGFFGKTVDFDPGPGIYNLTSAGGWDIYVLKLDARGNFVWAKKMGGTSNDRGQSIALDGTGNVFTTGSFWKTADFDPGSGIYNLTSTGGGVFVQKLDASGNFVWAKQMGGVGNCIATDGSGNVSITGYFSGTADFDPGLEIYNLTSVGMDDIFVKKMKSNNVFSSLDDINVFPNPTEGNLVIDLDDSYSKVWIEINDLTGKQVYLNVFHSKLIDLSFNGPTGMYFISIYSDKDKATFKLLKK